MFEIDPAEIGFDGMAAAEATRPHALEFKLAVDKLLLKGSQAIGNGNPDLEDYAFMILIGSAAQTVLASALQTFIVSGFSDKEAHGFIANASRMMMMAIDNMQETLGDKIAMVRAAKESANG
jgi:hypothetical protein